MRATPSRWCVGSRDRRRVKRALEHTDLNTTLGIHGHFDAADLREAFEAHAAWVAREDTDLTYNQSSHPNHSEIVCSCCQ